MTVLLLVTLAGILMGAAAGVAVDAGLTPRAWYFMPSAAAASIVFCGGVLLGLFLVMPRS